VDISAIPVDSEEEEQGLWSIRGSGSMAGVGMSSISMQLLPGCRNFCPRSGWELEDAVGVIGGNAGCITFVAVRLTFATFSHVSQSCTSSVDTLSPYPTFWLLPLSFLPAVPPLVRQHPNIALGLLVRPPVCLCSRVLGISIFRSSQYSTRFCCVDEAASLLVPGGTPCEKVESGDKFHCKGTLPIRIFLHSSPFATCIIQ
jgi:hypothetical protein